MKVAATNTMFRLTLYAVMIGLITLGIMWRHGSVSGEDNAVALSLRSVKAGGAQRAQAPITEQRERSSFYSSGSALKQSVPPSAGAAQDRADVSGRPFPLSDSADAECKWHESTGSQNQGCPLLREGLAKLEREPRDKGWAPAMERRIRDYVEAKRPGEDPIRALECRTSLCAIECADDSPTLCTFDYAFCSEARLLLQGWATAYETTSAGASLSVTVRTYERREPLE